VSTVIEVTVGVVLRWPPMCPCCGVELGRHNELQAKTPLGFDGGAIYYVDVSYCRRCLDHILRTTSLQSAESSALILGRKTESWSPYGWSANCTISRDQATGGFGDVEPPITPDSRIGVMGRTMKVKFARDDYAMVFKKLNPEATF